MFQLDERLQNDTVRIGNFKLCEVLLMNDANYPWVILVPRVAGITEVHQLCLEDQLQLASESAFVSGKMQVSFQADKMNIAALGNQVSQLHIHHIARYHKDSAWPRPVWGVLPAKAYEDEEKEVLVESMAALFSECFAS